MSGDKNLIEKCDDDKNIIPHESFLVLSNHPDFKNIEIEYRNRKITQTIRDRKLLIIDNKDSFENAVDSYIRKINHLQFEDIKIPSDDHKATIYAIDNVKVTIDETTINYISGKYFVPILVSGEASIDYAMFKADYWILENSPAIAADINKHYFLIEDTVPIMLKKLLIFLLPYRMHIKQGITINSSLDIILSL